MLVRDVMDTHLVSVEPETTIREVAQLLIDHKSPAAFVCASGMVIGVVSHADILRNVFPSYEEFYDDLVHNIDFDEIQERTHELSDVSAKEVMTKRVLTVPPTIHVMKVAAWMLLEDVYRVAVVDEEGKMIGSVSRGDIFYHTMANEMGKAGKVERRKRPRRDARGRRSSDQGKSDMTYSESRETRSRNLRRPVPFPAD